MERLFMLPSRLGLKFYLSAILIGNFLDWATAYFILIPYIGVQYDGSFITQYLWKYPAAIIVYKLGFSSVLSIACIVGVIKHLAPKYRVILFTGCLYYWIAATYNTLATIFILHR